MPIYEYRCSSCGHELEALQKLSDAPLVACPSCKTDTLVKQVSAAGFQLKGSGWYATDFKGGTKAPGKKPESEAKKGTESKAESPAESKSEGAAADKPADKSAAPACGGGACPACS